jgi:hypothetical protein
MCQHNQDDFFDQSVAQSIDGMVDEDAAVVKRNYPDSSDPFSADQVPVTMVDSMYQELMATTQLAKVS